MVWFEHWYQQEPPRPPAAEPALTGTDNLIIELLEESEKYRDALLDIPSDIISDTMSKLKVSSDEFKAGADILGEQILGSLYKASDEVLHETYEEMFPVITTLTPPPKDVADEIDKLIFKMTGDVNGAIISAGKELDGKLDTFLGASERTWSKLGIDIGKMQEDIDLIQEGFPEFIAQKTADLAANSFSFLLDRLIDTFFEEV